MAIPIGNTANQNKKRLFPPEISTFKNHWGFPDLGQALLKFIWAFPTWDRHFEK